MPEAVRLVIWDLDETFWSGTLSEGGIKTYSKTNHDIVVTLAKRGIISSICSKNDYETVQRILSERKIWDYFVFPSISWEPKGQRIGQLISDCQLRPESVLFIDDIASNRAEAASLIPGLQVRDESHTATLLNCSSVLGKDDANLSRLKQYKVLEKRKKDQAEALGDNIDFLRRSGITVSVEYDIAAHMHRAVELINRTNQLNFTKRRLSENLEEAKAELSAELSGFDHQAGLVHVSDNYGDYGFVGFYLIRGAYPNSELRHYCFSCRTLGMYVETWLFAQLQYPALQVVGEVLTDLNDERTVDWIRQTSGTHQEDNAGFPKRPEIRLVGGCEVNSIGHYLAPRTESLAIESVFSSGPFLVRGNSTSMLLSAATREGEDFRSEMASLGLPYENMLSKFLKPTVPGALLVFGAHLDSGYFGYRHKQQGWEIKIEPSGFWDDLTEVSEDVITKYISENHLGLDAAEAFTNKIGHLQRNYSSVRGPSDEELELNLATLFAKLPRFSRLVIIAPGEIVRNDGKLEALPWLPKHLLRLRRACQDVPYVRIVHVNDCINSDEEIKPGWNHYDRMVYFRLAQKILQVADDMHAKENEEETSSKISIQN